MVSKGKRKVREVKRTKLTVLVVGEGKTEVAFVRHLKSLYQPERSPPVRIDVENGKDSGRVLRTALKITLMKQYDVVVCLYDLDKALPKGDLKKAVGKKFILIGSEPSIEGFMLSILEKSKPYSTCDCKDSMHPLLGNKETNPNSYKIFTKDILEKRRSSLPDLDTILNLIETGGL